MEIPLGIIRTTLKLSKDMTAMEVREALAKAKGIPLEQVPFIDFEAEKSKVRWQYDKVQEIIKVCKAKFKNDRKTPPGKYEELDDIGKFILFANEKFQIYVPEIIQEYPDFTLLINGLSIGVEHTRLWDNSARAMFRAATYYISKAEEIIASDLSNLSKTVNIFIDYEKNVIGDSNFDERKFSNEQKQQIPHLIANFVKSELMGGYVPKPSFISQIEITRNQDSRVDLVMAETYFTNAEPSNQLLNCIAKKESKADRYRNIRTVSALWLLIVIDDVNSFSGFNLESAKLPSIKNSNFDSILIFEKFTGNIHVLYSRFS